MKTITGLKTLGLLLLTATAARANTGPNSLVQTFNALTPLTIAGPGALPQLNTLWSIEKYQGLAADLLCVTLELKNTLTYEGSIVSTLTSQPFNLQVQSDFKVDFGAALPGAVTGLDPVLLLSGVTAPILNNPVTMSGMTNAPAVPPQLTTLTTAGDLAAYLGNTTIPVLVTANLLTSPPANYHNNDQSGSPSPAVFVDNLKVFPEAGLQAFRLESSLVVTYYFVPETGTSALGVLGIGVGVLAWRRKRRAERPVA